MDGEPPQVSVVVPTYNRDVYLRDAIGSVFAQTYPHWELIVVDDGSSDGTHEYLAALTDPRVRAITLEHCGKPGRVRNVGIECANGRYVAFLDSDDVWRAQKLEMQIDDLQKHPRCRWGYSKFCNIDDLGRETAGSEWPNVGWIPCSGWILKDLLQLRAGVVTPTVIVETALLREVGGFDESFMLSEDADLWFRLAMRAEASVVASPLVGYRRHDARIRHHHPARVHMDWIRAVEYVMVRTDRQDIHALCRRRCSEAMFRLTAVHRREREYRRAWLTVGAALRYKPSATAWMVAILKTVIHSIMPEAALRVWNSRRGSARRRVQPRLLTTENRGRR